MAYRGPDLDVVWSEFLAAGLIAGCLSDLVEPGAKEKAPAPQESHTLIDNSSLLRAEVHTKAWK